VCILRVPPSHSTHRLKQQRPYLFHFYAASPVCTSSRAALLTGQSSVDQLAPCSTRLAPCVLHPESGSTYRLGQNAETIQVAPCAILLECFYSKVRPAKTVFFLFYSDSSVSTYSLQSSSSLVATGGQASNKNVKGMCHNIEHMFLTKCFISGLTENWFFLISYSSLFMS